MATNGTNKFRTGISIENGLIPFLSYIQKEKQIQNLSSLINFIIKEYKKTRTDLCDSDFGKIKKSALERRQVKQKEKYEKGRVRGRSKTQIAAEILAEKMFEEVKKEERKKKAEERRKKRAEEIQQQKAEENGFMDLF